MVFQSHVYASQHDSLPDCLVEFLEDSNILKVGVGCATDAVFVSRSYPDTQVNGICDVGLMAMKLGITKGNKTY